MILLLGACSGTITFDGTTDEARTAMLLAGPDDDRGFYWIANSPASCEPDDVDDDPTTIVDERADAQLWWLAEIQGAFTREGAIVVLIASNGVEDGTYFAYDPLVKSPPPGPSAIVGYYRVLEAELSDFAQYWFEYDVVAQETGLAEGAYTVADGVLRTGFGDDAPAIETPVSTCENQTLRNLLAEQVNYLTGGLVIP